MEYEYRLYLTKVDVDWLLAFRPEINASSCLLSHGQFMRNMHVMWFHCLTGFNGLEERQRIVRYLAVLVIARPTLEPGATNDLAPGDS